MARMIYGGERTHIIFDVQRIPVLGENLAYGHSIDVRLVDDPRELARRLRAAAQFLENHADDAHDIVMDVL